MESFYDSIFYKISRWENEFACLSIEENNCIVALLSIVDIKSILNQLPFKISNKDLYRNYEIFSSFSICNIFNDDLDGGIYNCDQMLQFSNGFKKEKINELNIKFHKFIFELAQFISYTCIISSFVLNAKNSLHQIINNYHDINITTNSLNITCLSLIIEVSSLLNLIQAIKTHLTYFCELIIFDNLLNSQTVPITSDLFIPMLTNLDKCISFLENHPYYLESTSYIGKYNVLLSKASNLIRLDVIDSLRNNTDYIMKTTSLTTELHRSIFYGKFKSLSKRVAYLIQELENIVLKKPNLRNLLSDCHLAFYQQRTVLIIPILNQQLIFYEKQFNHSTPSLVRSGCSYCYQLCLEEYELFSLFFSTGDAAIMQTLNCFCSFFYEFIRPKCIKLMHLETLTTICDVLLNEFIKDKIKLHNQILKQFEQMIMQLLEDVQQRLIYRSQKFIQSDIAGFIPSQGDLAYPEKLVLARQLGIGHDIPVNETLVSETGSLYSIGSNKSQSTASPSDQHAMWYPTVRRTLLCLSKIYPYIEQFIFESIAQEAIFECIKSIQHVALAIEAKKGKINSSLFLIKHILILREQLIPFQVEFSVKEIFLDFSRTKEKAKELLTRELGFKLFRLNRSNAFLELLLDGAPEIKETVMNSKKELDIILKSTCEEMIQFITTFLTSPLIIILDKFNNIKNLSGKSEINLDAIIREQPFARPVCIQQALDHTMTLIKSNISDIFESLHSYLIYHDTVQILFKPVRINIQNLFTDMKSIILQYYNENDKKNISYPSVEEISFALMYKK